MTQPPSARSKPTDRPDAHCPDCPFSDRGDWVMYRDEYEALRTRVYEAEKERDELRTLCEMVDAHYSGSLDHRPHYVKRIREALHA